MSPVLYRPFDTYQFESDRCFLTGALLNAENSEVVSVFPDWIIKRYELGDKSIAMLADNYVKYQLLFLPCSKTVYSEYLNPLQDRIKVAFELGYDAVQAHPQKELFQWMALMMYGMLYNDIVFGIKAKALKGEEFRMSPLLNTKISDLHAMLQSIVLPMEFLNGEPWSIAVVKVGASKDLFNYKDETKNLNFSLNINGFGILASLQDQGCNVRHHSELLKRIEGHSLHPVQYEELWSRFLYANYLLATKFTYQFTENEGKVVVQCMSDMPLDTPNYAPWEEDMFVKVLLNYWKPWGLTKDDILNYPEPPVSYLINDYTNQLIDPKDINLPS